MGSSAINKDTIKVLGHADEKLEVQCTYNPGQQAGTQADLVICQLHN